MEGELALAAHSSGFDFADQPVSLSAGNFTLIIPAGKIRQDGHQQDFAFHGVVNGLNVEFELKGEHGRSTSFEYKIQVLGVDVNASRPATITLKIGRNIGTATADFHSEGSGKD